MKPVHFKESNVKFIADGCGDLPAYKDEDTIHQCWKMSFFERLKCLFTGKIWVVLWSKQQPPMCVTPDKTVILEENGND